MKKGLLVLLAGFLVISTLIIFMQEEPSLDYAHSVDAAVSDDEELSPQLLSLQTPTGLMPKNTEIKVTPDRIEEVVHVVDEIDFIEIAQDQIPREYVYQESVQNEQYEEDFAAMVAQEEQQAAEYAALVDYHLQVEEVDSAWSDEAASTISYAFGVDTLQTSMLQSVDCRSTLCKLEVFHDENYDQEAFTMAMMDSFAETLPQGTMYRDPARPGVSVIYLARKGHSLPAATGQP